MKHTLITLSLLLSFSALAKDMSRTESYDDAFKEASDGSLTYVGKCSVHQDYEGVNFNVSKVLVEQFELKYEMTKAEFMEAVKAVEPELINAAVATGEIYDIENSDDFAAERIVSTKFKNLDLYRLNIGVGGGNGMFLIFNRTVKNNKPNYEYLAFFMDGDVSYCDEKVWLK